MRPSWETSAGNRGLSGVALPWALHFKVRDQGQTCACHVVNDNSCTLCLWLLKQKETSRTKDLGKFSRLTNPRYAACKRVGKQGGHYVIQEEVRALSPTMNATERVWEGESKQVKESEKGQRRSRERERNGVEIHLVWRRPCGNTLHVGYVKWLSP